VLEAVATLLADDIPVDSDPIGDAMTPETTKLAHRAEGDPTCVPGQHFPLLTSQTEVEDTKMFKFGKSKAEEQLASSQKKAALFLKEKEMARKERSAHVARLRTLRLAKEAADKEAADSAARPQAAAKN